MTEIVYHVEDPNILTLPANYTGKLIFKSKQEIIRIDYYQDGVYHRIDGPAKHVIKIPGEEGVAFHLKGKLYFKAEDWFEALTEDEKLIAIWNLNEWGKYTVSTLYSKADVWKKHLIKAYCEK